MYDADLTPFTEPFTELRNQGVLHAADGLRMSKSKGNVVTPDEVVAEYGTDALRAYILFIGPFDGDVIWNDANIKGVVRFLERYWQLANDTSQRKVADSAGNADASAEVVFRREIHRIIQRITNDFEKFKFNTAVAALMQYSNYLYEQQNVAISNSLWREAMEQFTILLAPIAPFITEEVWQELLGHQGSSIHQQPWPEFDETLLVTEDITMMVQINGKLRDRITVPADIDDEKLRQVVLAREKVKRYVDGKSVRNTIIVPQRLVNIVVN
jgi:leucyl-tRNA synthetase